MIPIGEYSKADILAALYNASRPLGLRFLHYDPTPMTREEAAALLEQTTYFDYLKGRVMKIDLHDDVLDPRLYDRDNGDGAAARALAALRGTGLPVNAETAAAHKAGTAQAAATARSLLDTETRTTEADGVGVTRLGLADAKERLAPAIDAAAPPAPEP